jgi:hypothetical protein
MDENRLSGIYYFVNERGENPVIESGYSHIEKLGARGGLDEEG